MPVLFGLALILFLMLSFVALMPLSLVMRYRAGTARRQARGWMAGINAVGMAVSAGIFLLTAAITTFWVPNAFRFTALGLLAGCALGIVGLWMSRWERATDVLHYTPNRWLVLALTGLVASRIVYGFWRGFHAWRAAPADTTWLAAAGAAGSMGVGALVIGYYFAYWSGLWRRVIRHREGRPSARGWFR